MRGLRTIPWLLLPAAWLIACAAFADVYTWVDAAGNTNVSNLAPPGGARVLRVTHETPAAIARADALQKAAQEAQLRTLSDRVAELERAAEQSTNTPPPIYAAPAYAAQRPAQLAVASLPAGVQPDDVAPPLAAGCAYAGCGWGLYPAPIVVISRGFARRDFTRGKRMAGIAAPRHRFTPPAAPIARPRAMPTGRGR